VILSNWKLRTAYILCGVGLGIVFAWSGKLPPIPSIGVFVGLSVLRIVWEARRS
jgi:hypothetical protein